MKQVKTLLLAILAIAITMGALWYANRTITPRKASWNDVVTEADQGGYRLVSTEELWQHYQKKPQSLLLADTRQEWEYRTGHIKSALNFPMEPTWLSRWQKKRDLEKFLGSDKDRFIVFY